MNLVDNFYTDEMSEMCNTVNAVYKWSTFHVSARELSKAKWHVAIKSVQMLKVAKGQWINLGLENEIIQKYQKLQKYIIIVYGPTF